MIPKHRFKILGTASIIMFFLTAGCGRRSSYNSPGDLWGTWNCISIEITTQKKETVSFAMNKYGYANMIFDKDSSYSYNLEILRDVVIEKGTIGNLMEKRIIQAGYKRYRSGSFLATNDSVVLFDADRIKVITEKYCYEDRVLSTTFIDNDNKRWTIKWEKSS